MSDFFEKLAKSIFARTAKGLVKKVLKKEIEPKADRKQEVDQKSKVHQWRQCPIGEHWVTTHSMKVPISTKNPLGTTSRNGHCALNPKRNRMTIADYIEPDEINYIAEKYFSPLVGPPVDDNLGFENGNKYDHFIRGWTKYWNDVFKFQS